MKSIWEQLFITDIDYTIKVSELIYYWIINIGILWIAYKTYKNSIKKEVNLTLQLTFDDNDFRNYNLYLDIYNYGNYVAKNIYLKHYNEDIISNNNSILNNDIGFIAPNTFKRIHVGYFFNKKVSFLGSELSKEEFLMQNINIGIKYNDGNFKKFKLNTKFLKKLDSRYIGNDYMKEISKSLKSIDEKFSKHN